MRRLLDQAYDPMVLYDTKYFDSAYPDNGVERVGGDPGSDWCAPRNNMNFPPGNELFVNAYRVYLYDLLVRAANVLGKTEYVEKSQKKTDHLRTLIHARYFKPEEGFYDSRRQLDQAMPLLVGSSPRISGKTSRRVWKRSSWSITRVTWTSPPTTGHSAI